MIGPRNMGVGVAVDTFKIHSLICLGVDRAVGGNRGPEVARDVLAVDEERDAEIGRIRIYRE